MKTIILIALMAGLTACGGGGGTPAAVLGDSSEPPVQAPPITLTHADLEGEYTLYGSVITFADGRHIVIDPDNREYSISGSMTITPGVIRQTISSLSLGFVSITWGSYDIKSNDTLRVNAKECVADMGVELKHLDGGGRVMTTTMPMGACGRDRREADIWYTISSAEGRIAARKFLQVERYPVNDIGAEVGTGVADILFPQY